MSFSYDWLHVARLCYCTAACIPITFYFLHLFIILCVFMFYGLARNKDGLDWIIDYSKLELNLVFFWSVCLSVCLFFFIFRQSVADDNDVTICLRLCASLISLVTKSVASHVFTIMFFRRLRCLRGLRCCVQESCKIDASGCYWNPNQIRTAVFARISRDCRHCTPYKYLQAVISIPACLWLLTVVFFKTPGAGLHSYRLSCTHVLYNTVHTTKAGCLLAICGLLILL